MPSSVIQALCHSRHSSFLSRQTTWAQSMSATIYWNACSSNERCLIRDQEGNTVRHFLWLSIPAQGMSIPGPLKILK